MNYMENITNLEIVNQLISANSGRCCKYPHIATVCFERGKKVQC